MIDGPELTVGVDFLRTLGHVERVGVGADARSAASGLGKLWGVLLKEGLHGVAERIVAIWVPEVIPPEGDGSTGFEKMGDSIKTRLRSDPMEGSGCGNNIERL